MAGGGGGYNNYSGNWGGGGLGVPRYGGGLGVPRYGGGQIGSGNKGGDPAQRQPGRLGGGMPPVGSPDWIAGHPDYYKNFPGGPAVGSPGWIAGHPDYYKNFPGDPGMGNRAGFGLPGGNTSFTDPGGGNPNLNRRYGEPPGSFYARGPWNQLGDNRLVRPRYPTGWAQPASGNKGGY